MSAGMDASVAPAFCHPAFPAGLLRRRQHALLACCLRSLYLLLCLLVFCPAEAGAEGDLPPAPPAPSLSLELEQLDLSGLPGLPPLPAEDEVLPAAATQALPLPDNGRQRRGRCGPAGSPPLERPGRGARICGVLPAIRSRAAGLFDRPAYRPGIVRLPPLCQRGPQASCPDPWPVGRQP